MDENTNTEISRLREENVHLRLQCLALTEAHESITAMVEKQREMIALLSDDGLIPEIQEILKGDPMENLENIGLIDTIKFIFGYYKEVLALTSKYGCKELYPSIYSKEDMEPIDLLKMGLVRLKNERDRLYRDKWRLWNPGADSTFTGEKKENKQEGGNTGE